MTAAKRSTFGNADSLARAPGNITSRELLADGVDVPVYGECRQIDEQPGAACARINIVISHWSGSLN